MKNAAFISLCLVGLIWLTGMFAGKIKPFHLSIIGFIAICGIGYLQFKVVKKKSDQPVQQPGRKN